ncbi:MAG TPA: hypothetical protein VHP33_00315 [Polyangiaceae bacterium]|nr:hypothetical protein [Polyangiaceae bacterium]
MATLRVWALLGLSATLIACSGDDHPRPAGDEARALPECPDIDTRPCDTHTPACQARLLAFAGCIYGVDQTPNVPVRVVTEARLIEELNAEDAEAGDETADEAADVLHSERALVDLQLLQPGDLTDEGGSTAQIVASIDGVYQDAERGIALVDRGKTRSDANANALLLHEFVHAIQDAEFNLEAWRERHARSTDASLALRTVPEGQATYAQFRAYLAMTGRDVARIDWDRTLGNFRDDVIAPAFDAPSRFLASITTFPYAYGAANAFRNWPDHQAQFDAPPLTTLQVLSEDAGIAFAAPAEFGEAPTPDADYRLVDSDTLGAFVFSLSAHGLGAEVSTARGLGQAWRGDQLYIYAGPAGETVWLWMLQLADIGYTGELAALVQTNSRLEATASGTRVTLIGGDRLPQFVTDAGAAFLRAP